ncbi:MAG: GNAT family N-acetyltransferase [Gammaproteobacteria bacterium]|nr:GNAT family N-acetyltransferase [Gammaproteobacteria bacterium]
MQHYKAYDFQMSANPRTYHSTETLPDGGVLHLRAIRPGDREALLREFRRLSQQTVRDRFFYAKQVLTPKELTFLTEVDFRCHVGLVAELEIDGHRRPVAVGRFMCEQELPDRSEIAITVVDEMQGRGIGKALLKHLIHCARELGVRYLDAMVLSENKRMYRLMRRTGLPIESRTDGSVCTLSLQL